ncbi:hypothetical protein I3U70_26150 [Mycobacteroides abscessus subsp. abscessus]|nr:hypothetical protein [Mycobacteroides abscessus subsp. abscessus]
MYGATSGVFSFRGRVITAVLVLLIGIYGIWTLIQSRDPQFLLSLFPIVLGPLGIYDAVKRKRAGFFDITDGNQSRVKVS